MKVKEEWRSNREFKKKIKEKNRKQKNKRKKFCFFN